MWTRDRMSIGWSVCRRGDFLGSESLRAVAPPPPSAPALCRRQPLLPRLEPRRAYAGRRPSALHSQRRADREQRRARRPLLGRRRRRAPSPSATERRTLPPRGDVSVTTRIDESSSCRSADEPAAAAAPPPRAPLHEDGHAEQERGQQHAAEARADADQLGLPEARPWPAGGGGGGRSSHGSSRRCSRRWRSSCCNSAGSNSGGGVASCAWTGTASSELLARAPAVAPIMKAGVSSVTAARERARELGELTLPSYNVLARCRRRCGREAKKCFS